MNNERLIREMKKILHLFPHGVIINPFNSKNILRNIFTNQEFESKMVKINQDLDVLRDIKVDIRSHETDSDSSQAISTTLHRFLKQQQEKMHEDNIIIEHGVKVYCQPDRNPNLLFENNNENIIERVCTVKTLVVDWEGVKSCMHVFIDNSDIIKLEEAKSNNKCQKVMFASASHEFRTPLNAIMNSFESIDLSMQGILSMTSDNFVMNLSESKKQKELVKQLNKFLNMGKNSSILLLSLIDDILDLSKIEAGTIKINKSDFLVPELINEIHDIFIFQITQKKLELNIHIGERLKNNVINSDRHRIKQVFLNLISNALKFTFQGEIFIG
jgi:signal transduction histidine kinase